MKSNEHIYYDSLSGMLARFDRDSHRDRFTGSGLAEFKSWQTEEREILSRIIGLDRLMGSELDLDRLMSAELGLDRLMESELGADRLQGTDSDAGHGSTEAGSESGGGTNDKGEQDNRPEIEKEDRLRIVDEQIIECRSGEEGKPSDTDKKIRYENLPGEDSNESDAIKNVKQENLSVSESNKPDVNKIIRYKCLFEVDEYTTMPMYILTPQGDEGAFDSRGTWIALAGHQGGGKESVAGVRDIPIISEKIDFFNYDYGLQLAKRGYTVICPDPRGFGERRDAAVQGDAPEKIISNSCRNISNMAIPLGLSVIGLCTYDVCMLLDYLRGRLNSTGSDRGTELENRSNEDYTDPDFDGAGYSGNERGILKKLRIDPDDISVIGFSGGGMQALYLSAVREEIRRVVISGYMYGVKDSLLYLNNNCSCNYVPGLWEHLDMGDIASLIAPRPLIIQSCSEDHLNGPRGLENVYEQVDIIRKAYELYDADDSLKHDIRPGEHHFHSECLELI